MLRFLFFMGRPKKQISEKTVLQMATIGAPVSEIAATLDCGATTIKRRFGPAIKKGHEKCNFLLRRVLVREALKGEPAPLIFACKTLLGLKEPRDDAVTVNVTQQAISVNDQTKKTLSELHAMIRRESLLEHTNGDGH
jgi:hypothetical protein